MILVQLLQDGLRQSGIGPGMTLSSLFNEAAVFSPAQDQWDASLFEAFASSHGVLVFIASVDLSTAGYKLIVDIRSRNIGDTSNIFSFLNLTQYLNTVTALV